MRLTEPFLRVGDGENNKGVWVPLPLRRCGTGEPRRRADITNGTSGLALEGHSPLLHVGFALSTPLVVALLQLGACGVSLRENLCGAALFNLLEEARLALFRCASDVPGGRRSHYRRFCCELGARHEPARSAKAAISKIGHEAREAAPGSPRADLRLDRNTVVHRNSAVVAPVRSDTPSPRPNTMYVGSQQRPISEFFELLLLLSPEAELRARSVARKSRQWRHWVPCDALRPGGPARAGVVDADRVLGRTEIDAEPFEREALALVDRHGASQRDVEIGAAAVLSFDQERLRRHVDSDHVRDVRERRRTIVLALLQLYEKIPRLRRGRLFSRTIDNSE
mmetsp:Transcript_25330/g.85105  ORF Transcript_25330/g.85105 Transcript_25330/m.85105 type:complete len:338 (+) Transcript_25330:326-1339(+)